MQKTEVMILLYLLQEKENVNKTFRQIAEETGVSLGSVQGRMSELVERGFIIESAGKRILRKRGTLIDRWAHGYVETFKSKMLLHRFRFITPEIRHKWNEIVLGDEACWGGEAAVSLKEGLIQPGQWEIYVKEKANCLIATGRMIPDEKGDIFVYKKFWCGDEIPRLVIYGDLLATGDDRCIEVANRLRETL